MQTVRVDQLAEALAEAVRDGMRLEQERIIKLLTKWGTPRITPHCEIPIWLAVELIKGENK